VDQWNQLVPLADVFCNAWEGSLLRMKIEYST